MKFHFSPCEHCHVLTVTAEISVPDASGLFCEDCWHELQDRLDRANQKQHSAIFALYTSTVGGKIRKVV